MKNLKLTIDLLPKGAWGNNLSKVLPKKDWDTLRQACYERANQRCAICGIRYAELNAHEVWDFNIRTKTQTLKAIIALCPACHGVKHMRNSERIGYGESSKRHFLEINNCNEIAFAGHYAEAQILFEERNKVERWNIKADLDKFGGKGIEIKERNIPMIISPYENVNWETVERVRTITDNSTFPKFELGDKFITVLLAEEDKDDNGLRYDLKTGPRYYMSQPHNYIGAPKIRSISIDNYQGMITIVCDDTNKIVWKMDDEIVKTKYNIIGKFTTSFSVENLIGSHIRFILIGDGGQTCSQKFELDRSVSS
ncbi:MAG: hypothetical protein PHT30_04245 [Bacilli bacterium]|nr:hypothetical protein [Bacilli bacterium]